MNNAIMESILKFVSDSIIIMNEEGVISSINPAAGNLFGYHGSDVMGKHVELLLPDLFGGTISGTGRKSIGKKKSGTIFPVTVTFVESQADEGKCFIGIIREIVERKPWDQAQYLKLILEHLPDQIWVKDVQMKYTFANRAFLDHFGAENRVEGLSDYDFYPEEQAEEVKSQEQKLIYTGESITYKEKVENLHATSLNKITKIPIRDQQGQILGLLGITQDITEWQQTEELCTHLGKILDETIFEIYVFSPFPLQFIYMNQSALKNLGYAIEDIPSVSPVQLWSKFSDESFQMALDSIILGEQESIEFETNHKKKNGHYYPVDVKIQLISEKDKAPLFMAIVQDSSPRKEAEAIQRKAERALLYSNVIFD
ncbi:PAS domain S-box protein [Ammoniphilus sp. YIM 78166]|uniref:PAS domain S-box protein n=1 Tax=Ammoniphilus sp. YIM 78166 TaxID=1644106 RepID=UPI00106FBCEE|nr:PAS domain S-box protein [Ammoniphilus sp. YIM 78166]